MTVFPLIHIIFFIAAFFAPPGATRINVTGPHKVERWRLTARGWDKDNALWDIKGSTTVVLPSDGPQQTVDVSRFVNAAITHDWNKDTTLRLAPDETLQKTRDGFILRLNSDGPTERVYRILFRP